MVRGGAGFYYGPSTHNVGNPALNSDGYASVTNWDATCYDANGNTVYNGANGCPTPAAGVYTADYSLSNPFPNGVVPTLTTAPTGLGNNLGTTLNTVLRNQRTPTTYNFNFGLEYELPHQIVVSAAYVGSRGLFLPFTNVDLNQLDLATIQKYGYSLCVDTSDPNCQMVSNTWAAIQPPTNANYGESEVPLWVSLQKYPQFGSGNYGSGNGVIVNGYPAGASTYHSLQTKVQKRLTNHFTTLGAFTWAKLMTNDSNPPLFFVGSHAGAPQDWRNLEYEHSVSPQDVKYQFTWQMSYDLPIGKGRALNLNGAIDRILGGWTTNAILYVGSGIPIASPTAGALNMANGISYFNQRPDMVCNPAKGAPRTWEHWFNPDCFALPSSPFVPGTAPAYLDGVRTMGARDVDVSIYKTFDITERMKVRFDIASYNLFNKAQFGMPNVPDIQSVINYQDVKDSFGQITNTVNTPRQFQFGIRFIF